MSEADAEDDTPLVLDKPQKTEMSETIFIPVFFDARIPPQTLLRAETEQISKEF